MKASTFVHLKRRTKSQGGGLIGRTKVLHHIKTDTPSGYVRKIQVSECHVYQQQKPYELYGLTSHSRGNSEQAFITFSKKIDV